MLLDLWLTWVLASQLLISDFCLCFSFSLSPSLSLYSWNPLTDSCQLTSSLTLELLLG